VRVQVAHIFPAVLRYGEAVNTTARSFYAYQSVNKLILDAWCILDCCRMKYLEYAMSLCGSSSCKIHITLLCLLFKINPLLDSLSGHSYFSDDGE